MERTAVTAVHAIARRGETKRAAVWDALNEIIDPCSAAMSEPLGLADMGLVEEIRVDENHVEIRLVLTSPSCLFVGLFEEQIESKLSGIPWVDSVRVAVLEGETIWDEHRMPAAVRARLHRRRAIASKGVTVRRQGDEDAGDVARR